MDCRACGERADIPVFQMEPMPLAGAFALTAQEAIDAERYPLTWRWCGTCGLVNVDPPIDGNLIFSDYSYRASDVPALVEHHRRFAEWLEQFHPVAHLEIGGNDGVLARHCRWDVVNVDPSDAWVGPGFNEPFTFDLARRIDTKFDLITSSNAMAHFDGIDDALCGVRYLLHRDGVFVVEVHDLAATIRTTTWDTIYHEHAAEWSVESLRIAGSLHGLRLVDCQRLSLHGGLLRATFVADLPRATDRPSLPPGIGDLQQAYDSASAPPLPPGSIAYGAAARATVYLDHVRPDVGFVVDGSPRRAGRYIPGVGLPIRPPEEMGDPPAVLITAWTQAEDIKRKHPDYHGEWITAWPTSSS